MNKLRKYILVLTFSLFLSISGLYAQNIELSLKTAQGIKYQHQWGFFPGGVEISANYRFVQKDIIYFAGINARTILWGNQAGISVGISKALGPHVEIVADIQNGLALFYKKPLYAYSIGASCRYIPFEGKKTYLSLSLGFRFNHCPAYLHYGKINRILEIPMGISFFF